MATGARPAALRRPAAACTRTWSTPARADRRPAAAVLQGRQLRGEARRRGAHLLPARRRDDPARQGLRRPPRLRAHARRHDVRRRLRGRRGPAVLHGRAAQRRAAARSPASPAAPRATGRWTRTSGRRRPTPRSTSSASTTTSTTSTAPRARRSSATSRTTWPGVQAYIAEARLNPLKMPAEYAAIGRPQGPHGLERARRDLHRHADRRHLRQGRRLGAGLGAGAPGGPARASARKKGNAAWRDFRSAEDPEAPVTVLKKKFPYQRPPEEGPQGQPGAARPRARWTKTKFEVVLQRAPARARKRDGLLGEPALDLPPKQSNALLVSGARVGLRQAAGRVRPPDRLLQPADPDGDRPARPGHRRPRRGLQRREPLRDARPRAATTPGARPPRARTSSTPSPSTCASRAARGRPGAPRTTASAAAACRWRRWSGATAGPRALADTHSRRAPRPCAPFRTKIGLVIARGDDQGQAGGLHEAALDLHARARRRASASRASTTPT